MRYTAEFRGGDNDDDPDEWCVVDESIGICGSAILSNLDKDLAIFCAEAFNEADKKLQQE